VKQKSSVHAGRGQSFPCIQGRIFAVWGQGDSEGLTVRKYCGLFGLDRWSQGKVNGPAAAAEMARLVSGPRQALGKRLQPKLP